MRGAYESIKIFSELAVSIDCNSFDNFIVSNVITVSTALCLSTASTSNSVEKLLDAVTDSAAGKIKSETE